MIQRLKQSGYICFLVLMTLSAISATYSESEQRMGLFWLHLLALVASFVCLAVANWYDIKYKNEKHIKQIAAISMWVFILMGAYMFRVYPLLQGFSEKKYMLSYSCVFLFCGYLFWANIKTIVKNKYVLISTVKRWVFDNIGVLILIGIVALVAICQSGSEPRWDGNYLFRHMHFLQTAPLFNMSKFSFCYHISMLFEIISQMLGIISGSLQVGMTIGNISLLLLSVVCFYGIVKKVIKKKNKWEYTLMTLLYAVSPFLLGLAGYNYWDYYVITLFPVIVYFALEEKWAYHIVFALIMCFSKETAIIAYAFYCVGLLIVDFRADSAPDWPTKIGNLCKKGHYYGMLAVGLIWLVIYTIMPNWDGVGSLIWDWSHILHKLKVFYVLNFNWALTILAVMGIFFIWRTKDKALSNAIVPVLLSDFAFVVFSCLFSTVNHSRYIDSHIFVLLFLAVQGIGHLKNSGIRRGLVIVISLAMLIQNYVTWDPLTLLLFKRYDVGNVTMISSCETEYLSDSMVYNQQYRYFDKALDRALESVVEEDAVILFPFVEGRTWFFEGLYPGVPADQVQEQYYDRHSSKRVLYQTDKTVSINVCSIDKNSDIAEIIGDQTGYYFYCPCAGEELEKKISETMNILDRQEFAYGGFVITRLQIR